MHNIAICSGNPEELTQLQNIIDDYEEFSNEDFTVKVFPSSEALTLAMKSYRPDILVIDAAGGIETVRNLRRENYTGEIIFTASNGEHALEAFDLEARQYFIRPINPQKFFRTLEKIMPPKKFIIVKQRRNIRKILCDEILYCETNGKHQEIYTFNEKITVRITAREMKKLAPPPPYGNFTTLGSAYLLNIENIISLSADECKVIFSGGRELILSWKKFQALRRELKNFYGLRKK